MTKSGREIELEKKLEIAVKALKKYADEIRWSKSTINLGVEGFAMSTRMICVPNSYFGENGYEEAQQALKEIEKCVKSTD